MLAEGIHGEGGGGGGGGGFRAGYSTRHHVASLHQHPFVLGRKLLETRVRSFWQQQGLIKILFGAAGHKFYSQIQGVSNTNFSTRNRFLTLFLRAKAEESPKTNLNAQFLNVQSLVPCR